jgi:hypothetical protein
MEEKIFVGLPEKTILVSRLIGIVMPMGIVGKKVGGDKTHSKIEIDPFSISPDLIGFFFDELGIIEQYIDMVSTYNPDDDKRYIVVSNNLCFPAFFYAKEQ